MKKFLSAFVACLMALALTGLTACDLFGGGSTGETYSVTLYTNGGTLGGSLTSYTEGVGAVLPTNVIRTDYVFDGWYDNEDLSGSPVTEISKKDTGDKTFWAKWKGVEYQVTLILDGEAYTGNDNVTSYNYGEETPLPVPEKAEYNFVGWYEKSDFTGAAVTSISDTTKGNKTFYGKFEPTDASKLGLTSYGGYDEGAYVQFYSVGNIADVDISYKLKSAATYTALKSSDRDLIRENDGVVRIDLVGLAAGDYTLKVVAGTKSTEVDVAVSAYDRSGYAHFGASEGVGAYNNDGTPKDNAYIIYVTEETKNTVVAPWSSSVVGIANILSKSSNAGKPVIVRVIGTVGAATWSASNWEKLKALYDAAEKNSSNKIISDSSIVGFDGNGGYRELPKTDKITQQYLIENKYNELDESVYTELNGLTSYYSYSSGSTSGFDSYWNNCEISGASNVTVEGIGTDAKIFQWGLTWKKCSSIEVRNITFDDYTEDACSFEGSTDTTYTGMAVDKFNSNRLWVHHNTFNQGKNYWDVCAEQDKREGDGATDFKRCAYVTISYNHYFDNHKTGLIGADDNVFTANVTFHHNFYEQCNSRLPLGRQANMHMYNNYYFESSGTNMSLRSGAYAFIENCYFENANYPIQTLLGTKSITLNNQTVTLNAYVKVYNCEFVEDNVKPEYRLNTTDYNITIVTSRAQTVKNENIYNQNFDTDPTAFYYANGKTNVTRMDNVEDVPTLIPQLAGVHKN